MTKKPWSTQELDKLIRLSSECPPVIIARELSRPVTSVRKKMREIGVSYVTGEQWKKRQIQYLISDEGGTYRNNLKQTSNENEFESPVLDEFWNTLVIMARVAKKRGKRVDVLSFIDTYRKIRVGG
ncbi:hypothetical protein GK047_28415 [Paenibacillus sp. SYP-B3998]|uniref:Uncharacterized protein n=1 Tax=Paenibacillus sp. SYP-B3998 TaxID=2678564 RepID=A0A6G4A898_9BACL|nr:hypothetical protein [Paenibacillus sp. SYP-B3998]NEW09847.1 hypothetical protein [Paenibacillus sp. SYP-B3998]